MAAPFPYPLPPPTALPPGQFYAGDANMHTMNAVACVATCEDRPVAERAGPCPPYGDGKNHANPISNADKMLRALNHQRHGGVSGNPTRGNQHAAVHGRHGAQVPYNELRVGIVFYQHEHNAVGVNLADDEHAKTILSRVGASSMICIAEDPATQFMDEQKLADTIEWMTAAGPGALPEQGWNMIQLNVWYQEQDADVMVYLFFKGTGALPCVRRPLPPAQRPTDDDPGTDKIRCRQHAVAIPHTARDASF
jgi:hypothetical protein